MKYGIITFGQMEAAINRCGGEEGFLDFLAGKFELVAKKFTIWLRTKVGGLSKKEIVEKLDGTDAGNGFTFGISEYAKGILGKDECIVTTKAEEMEFTIASLADLGFTENPMTKEFLNNEFLAKFGLELCRPDDAPSLRLAYTNQPNNEWLPIAMNPIRDSDGRWVVFDLKRDGSKLWLGADCDADPEDLWGLDDRFVFRVRKVQF